MFKNSHLLIILTLKRYECGDGGGGAIRLKKGDKKQIFCTAERF